MPEEEHRRRNETLQFIKVINDLLESRQVKEARNYQEQPGRCKAVPLLGKVGFREFTIRLGKELTQGGAKGEEEEFRFAPKDFSYPRYAMSIWSIDKEEPTMTPYGPQKQFAIDKNGGLWSFENIYFFDKEGRSKKMLVVTKLHPWRTKLHPWGYEKLEEATMAWGIAPQLAEKIKVDFVPKEKDGALVDLTGGDFEKLGYFLDLVKKGEIKPQQR